MSSMAIGLPTNVADVMQAPEFIGSDRRGQRAARWYNRADFPEVTSDADP
jgi:hypothetical protein